MHDRLISEHGGPPGLLEASRLESALASPRNLRAYGSPDIFQLGAAYATSLVLNHPFRDGNKRIALAVAGVFLQLNGWRLEAAEADAVGVVVALSTRELDAEGFATWLRENSVRVAKPASVKRSTSPQRVRRSRRRRP